MKHEPLDGAKTALLDEYQRALNDLKSVVATVQTAELIAVVDPDTDDPNCHSIQTVLGHVVRSAFSYATYLRQQQGEAIDFRSIVLRETPAEYQADLDAAMAFTRETLERYPAIELEVSDPERKILTRWGQLYDAEQLLEHAIVHLLRHRRQIERFLIMLRAH